MMLKRLVPRALGAKIALQSLGSRQQPLRARARDRIGVLPTVLLELALGLTQPSLPALTTRDDPLRIELILRLPRRLRLRPRLRLGRRLRPGRLRLAVLRQLGARLATLLLPRFAEELAPALRRAQPLGQLITARLAQLLILGLVGRGVLGQHLPRDLSEVAAGLLAGVPGHPRAVDRDQMRLH